MKRSWILWLGILLGLFVLCVALGSVWIPLDTTLMAIFRPDQVPDADNHFVSILRIVRLPRVLNVMLVGMALSLSGVVMQGLLQNPLADGSTLGISSGASLGAVLAILTGLYVPGTAFDGTFIGASMGAFISLLIILALTTALDRNYSSATIILVGIIFSMLTSSMINFLVTLADQKLRTIIFWTMGSLAGSDWTDTYLLAGVVFTSALCLWVMGTDLNAFALGELEARNIGVHVGRSRLIFLVVVAVLIGTAVSISGSVAFVGLIIPHLSRKLFGPNHRTLLPASMLVGGSFLMLADLVARTILAPKELPLGVITSFVGTLLFFLIMFRQRRQVGS